MYEKDYFDNTGLNDGDFKDIDIRELRNVNICSPDIYNNVVLSSILIIILFFIWYAISRPYIQDEQLTAKTTPF